MDEDYNMSNEWIKALTRGEVQADKPRPKKIFKDHEVSKRQRRGVMHGDK